MEKFMEKITISEEEYLELKSENQDEIHYLGEGRGFRIKSKELEELRRKEKDLKEELNSLYKEKQEIWDKIYK